MHFVSHLELVVFIHKEIFLKNENWNENLTNACNVHMIYQSREKVFKLGPDQPIFYLIIMHHHTFLLFMEVTNPKLIGGGVTS